MDLTFGPLKKMAVAEQIRLGRIACNHDQPTAARDRARNELVMAHLPLIRSTVMRHFAQHDHVAPVELVQEGVLIALAATKNYDPSRGLGFSPMLQVALRHNLTCLVGRQRAIVSVPYDVGGRALCGASAIANFLAPASAACALNALADTLSLTAPVDADDNLRLEDVLPSPAADPETALLAAETERERERRATAFRICFSRLSEIDKYAVARSVFGRHVRVAALAPTPRRPLSSARARLVYERFAATVRARVGAR